MIKRSKYSVKGALLILCGIIIAFCPGIITGIFYIAGLLIIIGSITTLIDFKNKGLPVMTRNIAGIIAGVCVTALPRFLMIKISVIAGLIFTVLGITRLVSTIQNTKSSQNKAVSIALSVLLILAGIFFLFNPIKIGNAIRIIIGLVLVGFGIFDFIASNIAKKIYDNADIANSEIIDVEAFSVNESNH